MSLTLAFSPLQAAYSVEPDDGLERIELAAGLPRVRRTTSGPGPSRVTLKWVGPASLYSYMTAFGRAYARDPQPFACTLAVDSAAPQEYTAALMSAPKLESRQGLIYTVSATALVQAVTAPTAADDELALWLIPLALPAGGLLWDDGDGELPSPVSIEFEDGAEFFLIWED